MRLVRDESACEGCGQPCIAACPKKPSSPAIFNCLQCHPADAECKKSGECPYGALCGKSDAIATAKCELCASSLASAAAFPQGSSSGQSNPPCISACPRKALRVARDLLGWRVFPPREGEHACCVDWASFDFSEGEQRLVDSILSRMRDFPQAESGGLGTAALSGILREICAQTGFALEKSRAQAVLKAAEMNSSGFGPLDLLLQDDDLEEISVVGGGRKIFVFHKARGWLKSNCAFSSDAHAINVINRMARPLGRRVTFQCPKLNASLESGKVRVHAAIPPLAADGVEITLRKFSQNPLSIPQLVSLRTISAEAAAFLWLALQADVSMVVAGNTGSGKTSTLNALLSFVPLSERVILVEETPELRPLHNHCIRLLAAGAGGEAGFSMRELVKDTLRMRPDRVVVGEARCKEEFEALFDSVLAGQARGTYATMHAKSAKDALARLSSFGIPETDLAAIDLVLVQRRIPIYDSKAKSQAEVRRVTELAEVRDGKAFPLFRHNAHKDELEQCGQQPLLMERLCANYKTSPAGLEKQMRKRAQFISSCGKKSAGFAEFAQSAQEFLFCPK